MEITAELDLPSLLKSVVSRAWELLKATTGESTCTSPGGTSSSGGTRSARCSLDRGAIFAREKASSGRVWTQKKTLIVNHYMEWRGMHAEYAHLPDFSTVGSPMHWGDTFFGVLCMLRDPTQAFEPAEGELLESFASQAAVALRNARLFEAARTQTRPPFRGEPHRESGRGDPAAGGAEGDGLSGAGNAFRARFIFHHALGGCTRRSGAFHSNEKKAAGSLRSGSAADRRPSPA